MGIKRVTGLKFNKGKNFKSAFNIVREEPLNIIVNGKPYAVLMRTPGYEEDLVLGLLYSEGVITRPEEIEFIHYCSREKDKNTVVVGLKSKKLPKKEKRAFEIRSSCGICGKEIVSDLQKKLKKISSREKFSYKDLAGLDKKISKEQKIFKQTGGTHAAGLFDNEGNLLFLREDIGRHNALDKVIGFALNKKISCSDKLVFLSGRTSYEMALKSIKTGFPVVASISGTTTLAVELCKKFNVTLIGFLRGDKMNIYSHPWRITKTV